MDPVSISGKHLIFRRQKIAEVTRRKLSAKNEEIKFYETVNKKIISI